MCGYFARIRDVDNYRGCLWGVAGPFPTHPTLEGRVEVEDGGGWSRYIHITGAETIAIRGIGSVGAWIEGKKECHLALGVFSCI